MEIKTRRCRINRDLCFWIRIKLCIFESENVNMFTSLPAIFFLLRWQKACLVLERNLLSSLRWSITTSLMKACTTTSRRCSHIGRTKTWVCSHIPAHQLDMVFCYLNLVWRQMFFSRCCRLPRHHHQVSCRSLVQVCTAPKVRKKKNSVICIWQFCNV